MIIFISTTFISDLLFQSKYSGTGKLILRYKSFRMSIGFEISRAGKKQRKKETNKQRNTSTNMLSRTHRLAQRFATIDLTIALFINDILSCSKVLYNVLHGVLTVTKCRTQLCLRGISASAYIESTTGINLCTACKYKDWFYINLWLSKN